MKHLILAKFNKDVSFDIKEIDACFASLYQIDGIHGYEVIPCCIDRPNRYDVMIEIDMDKEALELYDKCDAHHYWKEQFCPLLETKAIFDYEE